MMRDGGPQRSLRRQPIVNRCAGGGGNPPPATPSSWCGGPLTSIRPAAFAYTSFVAVDSKTRTQGVYGTTVHVAVPVPQGVRYETTVRESDPR